MGIEKALIEAVEKLERDLHAKRTRLERELASVEQQRLRLLGDYEVVVRASERRDTFSPILGRGHQCPSCWITSETRSRIRILPMAIGVDALLCDACGFRLTVDTS
jgi:hypothetical protein